ncbi:MAG: HAD family phosphatase [Lachnospiraceae bacterium]|nr:HAD family phosphatase [Lachnospiraceae bacterium]
MPEYKIVASDLDGTLLRNDATISEENKRAIEEMTKLGVHFVPSTGRAYGELDAEVKSNPHVRYIIHSNGAVIYDTKTGKRYTKCLPPQWAKFILDILWECNALLIVRHEGNGYVDAKRLNEQEYEYSHINAYCREFMETFCVPVDDFKDFCYSLDEIEMVGAFFHDNDQRLACMKRFEDTGELIVASIAASNLEVFSIEAGKGNALLRLADMLGVDRQATISVGDSTNDSTSIQAAGLGLAMSNGVDKLKEIADEVICSNEEHAMAYILEHYIKK